MQQLPSLVAAMGSHLLPWLPQLIELVLLHWDGPLLLQVAAPEMRRRGYRPGAAAPACHL